MLVILKFTLLIDEIVNAGALSATILFIFEELLPQKVRKVLLGSLEIA